MNRTEVAVVLDKEMKPGVGISLAEIMAKPALKGAKQPTVYFTLKAAAAAGVVSYTEKQGRKKLFKMNQGKTFGSIEFKKRGRQPKEKTDKAKPSKNATAVTAPAVCAPKA